MPPCGICHHGPLPSSLARRVGAAADPDEPGPVDHRDADAGAVAERAGVDGSCSSGVCTGHVAASKRRWAPSGAHLIAKR